jgi:hypothetical protein
MFDRHIHQKMWGSGYKKLAIEAEGLAPLPT